VRGQVGTVVEPLAPGSSKLNSATIRGVVRLAFDEVDQLVVLHHNPCGTSDARPPEQSRPGPSSRGPRSEDAERQSRLSYGQSHRLQKARGGFTREQVLEPIVLIRLTASKMCGPNKTAVAREVLAFGERKKDISNVPW
jgi:hypothetical protein